MDMLTEVVDHVIGIDPDRDRITAAVIDSKTTGVIDHREFRADPAGYRALIEWADEHTDAEGRVWSIEGVGSYGAGAAEALGVVGEWVLEFDRPATQAARDGAKSDYLDAVRAAREVLGREKLAQPRSRGTREAMRVLLVVRNGAQRSRVAAINQLKALLVTAPGELREELRHLPRGRLIKRCAGFRPTGVDEVAVTKTAMRAIARRIQALQSEIDVVDADLGRLVTAVAPQLLDEFGIGPVCAAQTYVSWSHRGRCRNEAAFARLAGVAPREANSGQTQDRHRLNRGGDRALNRALNTVIVVRLRHDPDTRAYIERSTARGKTKREAVRCLKRYLARRLYRLLENPPEGVDDL